MDDRLYKIVEYILNIADPEDLVVIKAALEKRLTEKRSAPVMGLNPAKMADQASAAINSQLEGTKDMVRNIAANFAADIIRQNAPELNEDQVEELLSELLPDTVGGNPGRGGPGSNASAGGSGLPSGMIIQMVQQFIEYSEGTMSPAEQVQMEKDIPGWKKKYWQSFPLSVRKMISLYLDGEIDRQRFDAHLSELLGV